MSIRNYFLTFLLVLLFLALVDCRCGRSQIVISKVVVEIPEGVPALASKESQEKLRQRIRQVVVDHPGFHFNTKAKNASLLRLSAVPEGRNRESFLLQAFLEQTIDNELHQQAAFAAIDLQKGSLNDAVAFALSEALQNLSELALGRAIDKDHLRMKLQESLQGKKVPAAELINAVSLLAKAKDKESAPYFVRILETTDDLTVVNASLLALSEIADESSMEAIINFAERKPVYIRRQAVAAARKVASPLAMQWLLVMAYGHEDATVRAEALEAFSELEAKQASLQ